MKRSGIIILAGLIGLTGCSVQQVSSKGQSFMSRVAEQARRGSSRFPVEAKDSSRHVLDFSGSAEHILKLDTVTGFIHVTGYSGRSVEITAERTLQARTQADMDRAKREVTYDVRNNASTVGVIVDGPFRGYDGDRYSRADSRWDRPGSSSHDEPGYRVTVDFTVNVPRDTTLWLRTVNDGNIVVDKTSGDFDIANVNGAIEITDVNGSGKAITVNGPVKATFSENPKAATYFQTVNGEVTARFRPNLDADILIKTMNGDAFTDFSVTSLPRSPATTQRRDGMTVFRSDVSGYRIGRGGPEIRFETLNGNIRVIRQTN